MRPLLEPRLIHGPCGDPGLYLEFAEARRGLLFDLPDLRGVSAGSPRAAVSYGH